MAKRSAAVQDDDAVVSEITDIVEQLKSDFAARDLLHQDIDNIIHREIPVNIPEAYRKTTLEVHTPLASHIANSVASALSINPPSVSFAPVGFGDTYESNATLREHFFEASFDRQEEDSHERLFRKFMYSLATKGEAVLKTVERSKRAWAGYDRFSKNAMAQLDQYNLPQSEKDHLYNKSTEEFKRGAPYPITTTHVIPSTFYYLKGEDGLTFASEVKAVPYFDTLEKYGYGLDGAGKVVPQGMGMPRPEWRQMMGKARTLKMIEAWDWQYATYLLLGPGQEGKGGKLGKGSIVKRIKHGYGDPDLKTMRGPYFHALGLTTDVPLPDKAGLGVLTPYLELFPLLDSLYTIRGNAAFMMGFPSYRQKAPTGATLPPPVYGNDGSEADGDDEQKVKPGDILPYDVETIDLPRSSFDFNQMINDVRGMIEMALPPSAQGQLGSDNSGYALNQASYLARLGWDPIVDNAEFALAERVGFESWLIENRIKEDVYVRGEIPQGGSRRAGGPRNGWLGIGPSDLNGVHRYRVKLDPKTPSNKVIEIRSHEEMLAQRLETRSDAINQLGGNPDEVERGWLLEDLKNDPMIVQKLKERTFQKLAVLDQQAVAAATGNQQGGLVSPTPSAGGDAVGQVYQPGQNGMPMIAPQAAGGNGAPNGMGGPPGNPPGMAPMPPGPPANNQPQPGQG